MLMIVLSRGCKWSVCGRGRRGRGSENTEKTHKHTQKQKHSIYIVGTCDRDLKRRLRKVPGVPIMFIQSRKFSIERFADVNNGNFVLSKKFVSLTKPPFQLLGDADLPTQTDTVNTNTFSPPRSVFVTGCSIGLQELSPAEFSSQTMHIGQLVQNFSNFNRIREEPLPTVAWLRLVSPSSAQAHNRFHAHFYTSLNHSHSTSTPRSRIFFRFLVSRRTRSPLTWQTPNKQHKCRTNQSTLSVPKN